MLLKTKQKLEHGYASDRAEDWRRAFHRQRRRLERYSRRA